MVIFNKLPTYYADGVASVDAAGTTVTGNGTVWTILQPGDLFGVHVGLAIPILEVVSATEFTLLYPWPGAAQTDADYCVQFIPRSVGVQEATRQLLLMLANGNLDAFAALLGGTDKIPIFTGPGTLAVINKSELVSGVQSDKQVATLADRATYDNSPADFKVLVSNVGDGRAALYTKLSNATADWSAPAYITGPVGADGVNPRGFYDNGTAYVVDDLVYSGGSTWIAKTATTGNAPPTLPTTENTQWRLFARAGAAMNPRGDYAAGTAYEPLDTVLSGGSSWVAKIPTTGNPPPTLPTTSNAQWQLLAQKGNDGTGTGDVVGPNGGTTAKQVAGFSSTTGKAIVGLTPAEVRSFAAVPISNFRNKIMNALGALNTRNVSGTVTLAAGAFGHDRMKAGASGCTYTFATSNGVTTFTITAGSLQHTIESRAFAGQAGRYWLSWSGTAQGRINGASYGASGAVFADLDASANVTVEFGTGTLSLPQLELDYVSAFSGRPQDVEEMLCRRYLPGIRSDGAGTIPTFGFAVNASSAVFTVPFPVRSRLKPTGLVVAGSASFTTFASDQAVTGWTFGEQTSEVAGEVSISTSGSGYTPSHAGWLRASGGALNIYFTGAEL